MNTFVVTINGTTFNFVVNPGTTIHIQENPSGVVSANIDYGMQMQTDRYDDQSPASQTSTRSISDISCISESVSDASEILDTIKNITFREKKTIEEDDNDFCREFQNITLRKKDAVNSDDDTSEYCKPVKHSYQKDTEGNYMCPYCDCKKRKVNTMSEHVRTNHSSEYGRNKEMFYCDDCGKGFPTKTRLDHHMKTFHTISYEKCPHPGCNYDTAKNASSLIQHYAKHHLDYKKMYKMSDGICICNDCGSSSKTGILYHLGICNKASPFYKKKNNV
jgi:hypothetical protein